MSPYASQLLLMALMALAGIWACRNITHQPVRRPQRYALDDLVWRDHPLSDDEAAWEAEWFDQPYDQEVDR